MNRFYRSKRRFLAGLLVCAFCWSFGLVVPAASRADITEACNTGLQLSLEDAVNLALKHSYALKIAEYNVEQSENARNDAASQVDFTPLSGGNEEATRDFLKLVQSDINWSMSKKNLEIEKDSLVLGVYQRYLDVLTAQEKVKSAEAALELANYRQLAAQAGLLAGTVSRKSFEAAAVSYRNQVSGLAQSRAALEQSYIKLNEFLGISGRERPLLTGDVEYSPLEITDLELEITRRLDSSPALWKAEQEVRLAELSLDLHTYTNIYNYNSTKLNINKAELSAEQAKEQARQNMRTMYDNIYSLQEQYNQQQQALRLAESDLESARLKYDMGLIPKGEFLTIEADLAVKRQELKSLVYQHHILKLNFEKPWASRN
ncbi:MAG: TolC family protein [Bacillota bacterium]